MKLRIREITIKGCGILVSALSASVAQATIIYNSSGVYSIQTPTYDNVRIEHTAADVTIDTGGLVHGTDTSNPTHPLLREAAVRVRSGDLNVTGNARIIAGLNQSAIDMTSGRADVRLSGNASISGDIFSDGTTPGWSREETALQRLYVQDSAVIVGNLTYSGHLRIQDQALIVGSIGNPAHGSMSMNMSGGVVTGSVSLGGLNDYVLDISGGSILGSLGGAPGYIDLMMSGGYVGQGIRSSGVVNGEIKGGEVDGGILINENASGTSHLTISGGLFDTNYDNWLLSFTEEYLLTLNGGFSTLDLWGGQFGYDEAGLGFFFDDRVSFSIHGRDLVYSNGWLTGYLMDGNWFSSALTFGSNWQGVFTVHNVPEPGTLALFLIGAFGLVAGRRRLVEGYFC